MAFRVDAGPGVRKTDCDPGLAIPVGRLGRHDPSFRYERGTVKVRQGSSIWEVWLNVHPAAIGEPVGSEPGLWLDEEEQWHARGDADYESFCAAANSTEVRPEPVLVVRRWSACRRGAGKERRPPTSAP